MCSPLGVFGFIVTLGFLAMSYTHPGYLGILFVGIGCMIVATGGGASWRATLRWTIFAAALIVIINPLVSSHGATLVWSGPRVPVLGRITVSLEALLFGMMMGLKMLIVVSLVCLYDRLVDVDRVLDLWSRVAPKTATTLVMTTLVLPRLKRDVLSIREALMARGAVWTQGSWVHRVRQVAPVFRILLLSSLEGSWSSAEALYARGFGSGKRSSYHSHRWNDNDTLLAAATGLLLAFGVASWIAHRGQYQFYPTVGPFWSSGELLWFIELSVALLMPLSLLWRLITTRPS